MRYVIIGAGGTGGPTGFKLTAAGHDVAFIARGRHLDAMQNEGLILHHLWDDQEELERVKAFASQEYLDMLRDGQISPPDVIFVCVKGYSVDDTVSLIEEAADEHTVIIPVLNIYTTGEKLRSMIPDRLILDGCIYVSANIESPGKILMHSKILRIIFGRGPGMAEFTHAQEERLKAIEAELNGAGIRGIYSQNIRRDAMKKFSYVSPIGAAGLYYGAVAGDFQEEGKKRELFISLMREIEQLSEAFGCPFDTDVIQANLDILAHQPPEATTSLQRDIEAGGASEIKGLIYDIPEIGAEYGLSMPAYSMVADELRRRYQ